MSGIILSINSGSSSVKVSVYSSTAGTSTPEQLADIEVSGLTAPPAQLKYSRGSHKVKKQISDVSATQDAFTVILDTLTHDDGLPELSDINDIAFACHRVVHGGGFTEPVRIDSDTYHHLEQLSDLAPLHNAGALDIARAVHEKLPKCTNIAFFDSMFHATIPEATKTYMIDQKKAKQNGLRKYGFHGLSYAFITRAVAGFLQKDIGEVNIIALHLGSGASMCAIKGGQSLDTTMGLTPLSGLPGATRSGDVDPSLIFHYTHDAGRMSASSTKNLQITEAEVILNKESGWKALTGTTDFGVVSAKAGQGEPESKLAFDVFLDRVISFLGSYYVKLGGALDAVVFAGGIGEQGSPFRKAVIEKVQCLGLLLDDAKNSKPEDDVVVSISAGDSKHPVLICQTDEQAEMARQCAIVGDKLKDSKSSS